MEQITGIIGEKIPIFAFWQISISCVKWVGKLARIRLTLQIGFFDLLLRKKSKKEIYKDERRNW